ncbi:tetraspanin-8-like isoform X2 [Stigmatopora argus]
MAKINSCLKCLFVFFNVVFAIIGCLLIFAVVKASVYTPQLSALGAPGLGWVWAFAIGVLGISCLGIYAGISEKELALKIFAGFMAAGMIIMLIFGIVVLVMRNKIRQAFGEASSELAEGFMAQEGFRTFLGQLQESGQCCGLASAGDWGDSIPDSCRCRPGLDNFGGFGTFGHSGCRDRPEGTTGPDKIYQQTCGQLLISFSDFFFNIAIGFNFGFAITAFLGLLTTLLMMHQVRRHERAGASNMAMKGY